MAEPLAHKHHVGNEVHQAQAEKDLVDNEEVSPGVPALIEVEDQAEGCGGNLDQRVDDIGDDENLLLMGHAERPDEQYPHRRSD